MGPYCSALLLLFRPSNRKKIQGRRPRTNVSKIEIRNHKKNMRTDSETVSQTERQTDTLINKQTKQNTRHFLFANFAGTVVRDLRQTKVVIAVFSHRSDPKDDHQRKLFFLFCQIHDQSGRSPPSGQRANTTRGHGQRHIHPSKVHGRSHH